ncbi:hypothetical protein LKV13_01550 [Borrelia sp. BU AG58]|uniref:hypothetical protein n=1 Tax=Borrelia sp. BU AG58 TaxID=2887345 RepID=UPI001E45C4E8|nr:hypothetical protein [Borrelia sp. BU AG58]UER67495.1 hypothetical protein LKV13_01550 [Borrelia sp. BU AG58]
MLNYNEENLIKYRKVKFLSLLIFLLILTVLFNFLLKMTISASVFYKFKHFEMEPHDMVGIVPSNRAFIGEKVLKLDFNKGHYSVLNNYLVSHSDYYYVISRFEDHYSVFLRETDKFLFSFKFKGFVFTKDNAIFALNNLYKKLEVYGSNGDKILSLKFIASILSIDYNNDVLSLGLSDGKVYVYKQGNLVHDSDASDTGSPVLCLKLSLDNKYLCVIREHEKHSLEVINLDNKYNRILRLSNLKIKNFDPFLKVDGFYNLFIEIKDSFLIINIESGNFFKIDNKNYVLKASYDSSCGIYRIYFYDPDAKIVNVRTYSASSFNLFDNIFFNDGVASYIELDKGILYFSDNGGLRYLGL